MENIEAVSKLCKSYNIPLIFDAARFAENAYFIKTSEKGYAERSIRQIILEMFSFADGMTMSSKKDAIVNMGGFIGFRERKMYEEASVYNIMFEGFVTYGGMLPLVEKVAVEDEILLAPTHQDRRVIEDIQPRGWAMQCRVYAEDPARNFLPSPGRIAALERPGGPNVRIDSGAYAGWAVPLDYDPLLAKLFEFLRKRSAPRVEKRHLPLELLRRHPHRVREPVRHRTVAGDDQSLQPPLARHRGILHQPGLFAIYAHIRFLDADLTGPN